MPYVIYTMTKASMDFFVAQFQNSQFVIRWLHGFVPEVGQNIV